MADRMDGLQIVVNQAAQDELQRLAGLARSVVLLLDGADPEGLAKALAAELADRVWDYYRWCSTPEGAGLRLVRPSDVERELRRG